MSYVINVIVTGFFGDREDNQRALDRINDGPWSEDAGRLTMIPEGVEGGNKRYECALFLGAFNYLPIEELKKHIRSLHVGYAPVFDESDEIEILYRDQHDDGFTVWRAATGVEVNAWRRH